MNWVDDDLGTDVELLELEVLLRVQFNYSTEIWKIPSYQSEDKLERKIADVKAIYGGEDRLLIIYYGGHGRYNRDAQSIWQAYVRSLIKGGSVTAVHLDHEM